MESRISKYALYAIGETILIVFGILIALHITNSNDEKRDQAREKQNIISLKADLQNDFTSLENVIEGNGTQLASLDLLLSQIAAQPRDEAGQRRLFINSVKATYWYLQAEFAEGTLSQLKYTGDLQLIRFHDVTGAILEYELGLRECENMNEEQRAYFHEVEKNQKKLMNLSLAKKAYEFIELDFMNMLLPTENFEDYVAYGQYYIQDNPNLLQEYYNDVLFYRTSLNNLNIFYIRQKAMADDLLKLLDDHYVLN